MDQFHLSNLKTERKIFKKRIEPQNLGKKMNHTNFHKIGVPEEKKRKLFKMD